MIKKNRGYIFETDSPGNKTVSNDIKITVVTTHNEFKDFFKAPWIIYKDDKYWVPPFWVELRDFFKRKNLLWTHAETRLFVAYRNNCIVGRIAAFVDNKLCETAGKKFGFFGFFECIKDFDVASALLEVVEEWLISKNISLMLGPINGRIDIGCGFLYQGFNTSPCILSSYSPEYYLDFAKEFGMKKTREQLIYHIDLTKPIPKSLENIAKGCEAKGIKIRRFNRLKTGKETKWWINQFLDTFTEHWGYIPVSYDEVKKRFGVRQLRWIVEPSLFLIAEVDDRPIAFLWSTPDYNQIFKKMNGKLGVINILRFYLGKRKINYGILQIISIKKEFRNLGIGSLLNYYTILEMAKRGYTDAECSWIDEKNIASQIIIKKTGATLYKKFLVFEKII